MLLQSITILFLLSVLLEMKLRWLRYVQIVLLGLFHYVTGLNWCVLLYGLILMSLIAHKHKLRDILPLSILLIAEYSLIRLVSFPLTSNNVFVWLVELVTFVIVILLTYLMSQSENEKRRLFEHNEYLRNHDSRTGLLNYSGYTSRASELVAEKTEFVLVMVDIYNYETAYAKDIPAADDLLINFAQALKDRFPYCFAVARYVGDRFALLLPHAERVDELLSTDSLGVQVAYSVVHFPIESGSLQELIQLGEDRIFQLRRENWLKRQEERSRSDKMRMVGELAAGMAHEIRNPLTSIQGFIQLSKQSSYNIEPWYDVIMNELKRVGDLTVEFLQFSKPQEKNMLKTAAQSIMKRAFNLCESEAASRGHTMKLNIIEQHVLLLIDRDKMLQVLLNLIRNAFQAMEQAGYVHLVLRVEGKHAIIEVRDNGCGIPEDKLNQIFDPFYTTKEDGTGLGLALCQKIIEDHQGSITVRSDLGIGSIFTILLPIVPA